MRHFAFITDSQMITRLSIKTKATYSFRAHRNSRHHTEAYICFAKAGIGPFPEFTPHVDVSTALQFANVAASTPGLPCSSLMTRTSFDQFCPSTSVTYIGRGRGNKAVKTGATCCNKQHIAAVIACCHHVPVSCSLFYSIIKRWIHYNERFKKLNSRKNVYRKLWLQTKRRRKQNWQVTLAFILSLTDRIHSTIKIMKKEHGLYPFKFNGWLMRSL